MNGTDWLRQRQRDSANTQALDALIATMSDTTIPTGGPCSREPDLWWSPSPLERQAAAALCWTSCPNLAECHAMAAATRPTVGIWAGIDTAEYPHYALEDGLPWGGPLTTNRRRAAA